MALLFFLNFDFVFNVVLKITWPGFVFDFFGKERNDNFGGKCGFQINAFSSLNRVVKLRLDREIIES